MDFDTIMREITSGLTGEPEHDIPYLQEQCQNYKNHEFSTEILRACGRLTFQLIPDDKKEPFNELLKKNDMGYKAAVEEAQFNIYKKNYDVAFKILEGILEKIKDLPMFQDDSVSEYHTFNEAFEEILYKHIYQPEKTLRPANPTWTRAYYLYGNLLFEMKRYEDAQDALKEALHWNPMDAEINFEYIETFKALGNLDTFFQLSKEAFRIAFRPTDVARCYRNIAFFFVEKEMYNEAMGCLKMSTVYEEASIAQSEMYYIHQATGGKAQIPPQEEFRAIAEKYGFPMGADPDVLNLAYAIGRHAVEQGNKKAGKYYLAIAYDLTGDARVKSWLDKCEE